MSLPFCAASRIAQLLPLWFSWTHCRGWNSCSMQAWHVISSEARESSCSITRSCRALQWSAGWWCSLHIRSTKMEFVNQPSLEERLLFNNVKSKTAYPPETKTLSKSVKINLFRYFLSFSPWVIWMIMVRKGRDILRRQLAVIKRSLHTDSKASRCDSFCDRKYQTNHTSLELCSYLGVQNSLTLKSEVNCGFDLIFMTWRDKWVDQGKTSRRLDISLWLTFPWILLIRHPPLLHSLQDIHGQTVPRPLCLSWLEEHQTICNRERLKNKWKKKKKKWTDR